MMSDVVLDTARYLTSPMTDCYRERSFKVVPAVSVLETKAALPKPAIETLPPVEVPMSREPLAADVI